jgi:radical SAM protein with 4Fe4S-binding SPASM domain
LSCVKLTDNKKEVKKIKKFWNKKIDQILKPVPENWSGNISTNSPWKYKFKQKMWPCRGMWDTLDFLWDGRVSLCCRDYDGRIIIGDINKQPASDILKHKRNLGYKHLEENYTLTPICYKCDTIVKNAVSWW